MKTYHHSPNINSGMQASHLPTKVGVCGSVHVQSHACYDHRPEHIDSFRVIL